MSTTVEQRIPMTGFDIKAGEPVLSADVRVLQLEEWISSDDDI